MISTNKDNQYETTIYVLTKLLAEAHARLETVYGRHKELKAETNGRAETVLCGPTEDENSLVS